MIWISWVGVLIVGVPLASMAGYIAAVEGNFEPDHLNIARQKQAKFISIMSGFGLAFVWFLLTAFITALAATGGSK